MAFLTKLGSIFTQKSSKQISHGFSATNPCIFQAIRCFSVSKIFVGGISYATDETSLRETFGRYGEVVDARVIIDRETGRSRGFGFITYTTGEEASSAIQALDGQELFGRRVRVNYANERPRSVYGTDNYGGGGSGYFGGSYGRSCSDYGGDNAADIGAGGGGGGGGGCNSSFGSNYASPAGGDYQGENTNSAGGYQNSFGGGYGADSTNSGAGYQSNISSAYGSNTGGGYGADGTNSGAGYQSNLSSAYGGNNGGGYCADGTNSGTGYGSNSFSSNFGASGGDYGGSSSSAPAGGFDLASSFGNASAATAADQVTANISGFGGGSSSYVGGSPVGPPPLDTNYLDAAAGAYQADAQGPVEMNGRDEDDDADGFAKRA